MPRRLGVRSHRSFFSRSNFSDGAKFFVVLAGVVTIMAGVLLLYANAKMH